MITHEQVRKFLSNFDYWLNEQTAERVQKYLSDYIAQCETQSKALTELEELKRDVKRYFDLDEKMHTDRLTILEAQEKVELAIKLSKVGEEE